jgi:hypothetical protein
VDFFCTFWVVSMDMCSLDCAVLCSMYNVYSVVFVLSFPTIISSDAMFLCTISLYPHTSSESDSLVKMDILIYFSAMLGTYRLERNPTPPASTPVIIYLRPDYP